VADADAPLEPDLPPPLGAAEEAESVAEAALADPPPPDAPPAEPPPEVLPSLVLSLSSGSARGRREGKGRQDEPVGFGSFENGDLRAEILGARVVLRNKERVSTVQLGEAEMSTHTNGKSDVLPSFDVGNPPHTPRFFDRRKRLKRRSASGTARKNCATGNRKSILVVKGRKEEDEPVMV
jgi:hypothetical protein